MIFFVHIITANKINYDWFSFSNQYGDTPLHTSARYGHAGVIRILVSARCNASEQNKVMMMTIMVMVMRIVLIMTMVMTTLTIMINGHREWLEFWSGADVMPLSRSSLGKKELISRLLSTSFLNGHILSWHLLLTRRTGILRINI